ncbi:MAG: hypothetical protein U0M02_00685 [Acutalibacteraceae bacterium]|nr:hypothetical protein [Acutalibacteraceae bacterium]
MDKIEYEVLTLLKKRFISLNDKKKEDFQSTKEGEKHSALQFCLKDLNNNLIEPMSVAVIKRYNNGDGNELESKMKSIRSSSAMTYNLFGNKKKVLLFGGTGISRGTYNVTFEEQISPLKSGRKANLDAFLVKDDGTEVVACEMKMMEWFAKNNGELSTSYFDEKKYHNYEKEFIEFAEKIKGEKVERTKKKNGVEKTRTVYKSNMERYDCFQMFKHLLACYNYCTEHKNVKKLTLVNCVWELNDPTLIQSEKMRNEYIEMLETEHREFKSFKSYAEFVKKLFKDNTGTDFEVVYYSFADFSNMIELSIREKEYLKRYIF